MHMETRQMEVGAGVARIRRSRGEYVRISERPSRRNLTNAPSLADECILFPQSGIGMQSAWKTLAGLAHSWIRTSPKAKPVKVQSPGSGKPLIIVLSANLFERRRICSSLDRKRYDVIEAANAPEALAAARTCTVLVVDYRRHSARNGRPSNAASARPPGVNQGFAGGRLSRILAIRTGGRWHGGHGSKSVRTAAGPASRLCFRPPVGNGLSCPKQS